jgi:hypothetical protein
VLTEEQIHTLLTQFPEIINWNLEAIRIDGENSNLIELERLLLEGNASITTISVE